MVGELCRPPVNSEVNWTNSEDEILEAAVKEHAPIAYISGEDRPRRGGLRVSARGGDGARSWSRVASLVERFAIEPFSEFSAK